MTTVDFDGEELFVLAKLDLEKGQVDAGLLKLKRALAQKGCPKEAQLEAARVYAQLGLRQKAQGLFKSYLDDKPDDVDARFQLGMILFEQGLLDAALPLWEQVLQRSPNHPPALFYKAVAAAQSGKTSEAQKQLRSLLDVVHTENLYFSRARGLLDTLKAGKSATSTEAVRVIAPGSAYRTDH